MSDKLYIDAIREALLQSMQQDDRVVVMGLDVGVNGGVFRTTDGLLEMFGERRVIDTPLAENSIVGVAIGMALKGLRPVAEIQFADFIHCPFDQIVSEAAKIHWRNNGQWQVPLVVRTAAGGGLRGGPYHSQSPEAFYCHVPGLTVLYPSTPYDAKGMLMAAIQDPNPVVFFEHKKCYRAIRGEVPDEPYVAPLREAQYRRRGADVSVVAYGYVLHDVLAVAEKLAGEGIEVEVLDPRILFPLDSARLVETARHTGRVVIVHEDTRTMGIGAEMAAIVQEEAFEALQAPVRRVTTPDVVGIPFAPPLEDAVLPNQERIEAGIRATLEHRSGRQFAVPHAATGLANGSPVPQASMTVEVDFSEVLVQAEACPGATPVMVVAAAAAERLALDPEFNCTYQDGEAVPQQEVCLRLLSGGREALIAKADEKNLLGLVHALRSPATGANLAQPSLTVVDLGTASLFGTPLVREGEAAALSVGAVHDAPVATGSSLAIKPVAALTLSVDHRLLDGGAAGRFCQALKRRLESSARQG
jgi:2-oxoisovalerate dehydrogenase E1 component beta subunit